MRKYFNFFSPAIFLAFMTLIFVFKTVPAKKLWKNYSVLYVQKDVPDATVKSALDSANVRSEISISNQYLPINISENSVEFSMLKLNSNKNDYVNKRANYFFDESQNFRLYYVPDDYSKNLRDVVSVLSQNQINCGIDAKQPVSFLLFLFFLSEALLLTFFSKNKILFLGTALIQFAFILSAPFYATEISCVILLLPLFFVSNAWRRKNFFKVALNNFHTFLILIASVLCNFSVSVKTGLLFCACLICVASYLYIFYAVENYFIKKRFFVPVYIKSARQINLFAKKTKIVMRSLILIALIFIIFFFLASNKTINLRNSQNKLFLPSNVANSCYEKSENLPQLEDFYKWTWNAKTFPYKSLNKSNDENFIEFSRYAEENGKIAETKSIFSYNQTFKDDVFDSIDDLKFNAIEKVLKSEGKDFEAGYVSNVDFNANLFSAITMIFCLIVLLFIYFFIMIEKSRKFKI